MEQEYLRMKPDAFGLNHRTNFQMLYYDQNDIEPHSHGFFELVYVLSGSAKHGHDAAREHLTAGDYFIIDIGSVHDYSEGKEFSLYNFLFLPEFLDETLASCLSFSDLIRRGMYRYNHISMGLHTEQRLYHDTDGRVLQIMELLFQEYHEQKLGYEDVCQNLVREIFIRMMRESFEKDPGAESALAQYPLPIRDALNYFQANSPDTGLITKFCNQYHYSREYFCRLFKKKIGVTPIEYVQKLRMEYACKLLSTTDSKISRVAEQCGYQDDKTFRATFKKFLGMSPMEYRGS